MNGRLAQLVEHLLDVQRVSGSSPLSSTKEHMPSQTVCVLFVLADKGLERRLLAGCRWHAATAVAFPQKSESVIVHQKKDIRRMSFFSYICSLRNK